MWPSKDTWSDDHDAEEEDKLEYRVKTAILGDWSTGKTSILNCLCGRDLENVGPTIGMGFLAQKFSIQTENWSSTFYMWDTSGTERYRSIITPYLRAVGIMFIVFDVGDRTTWEHVDYWRQMALENAQKVFPTSVGGVGSNKEEKEAEKEILPLFCLVGCQADKQHRAMTVEEIEAKAAEWKCPWYVVSTRARLKLQGTTPHVVASSTAEKGEEESEKENVTLVVNAAASSVWSNWLRWSHAVMTPQEQMFTVFGHMAVEFHRFVHRVGVENLSHETCSLAAPISDSSSGDGGVIRIRRVEKRKSKCCLMD